MFELLRILVKFTPTQKDDEILAQFEKFMAENPELAAMALKFVLSILRTKNNEL